MVIDTLRALLRLDYPRVQIVLIDDDTDDEWQWRQWNPRCRRHGVSFKHLKNWPGHNSGALNYALQHLTDPDAESSASWTPTTRSSPIGCATACRCRRPVDRVRAGAAGLPGLAARPLLPAALLLLQYFFAVSQPSRNERDGAIFAGTMGLIRRVALDELGGWDEWCITEDAEISLRLLRAGWSGMHVDESGGHGIMPLTFEALKGQRYRWCFGGIQLLRMHWKSLLPGRERKENHLSAGQRWSYLSGALEWYGDLLSLLFYIFLLAGAVNMATGGGQLFRKLTVFLVATVPVLVLLGLVRAIALVRRSTGASWRDALGAFFIWQSTSLVVARASVLALFAKKAAFLRTPKTSERTSWLHALRANWAETVLALFGAAGMAGALTKWDTLSGPLLGRPAARADPRDGRRAVQQLGRPPRRASRMAAPTPRHRVPARAPLLRRRHRGQRNDRRRRRGSTRDRADAYRPAQHRAQPRPPDPVPARDNIRPGTVGHPDAGHQHPHADADHQHAHAHADHHHASADYHHADADADHAHEHLPERVTLLDGSRRLPPLTDGAELRRLHRPVARLPHQRPYLA